MHRFVTTLRLCLAVAVIALLVPTTAHAQDSLSFHDFDLEKGTALSAGAVYRFHDVKTGVDALVSIDSLRGGATLTQLDDPSPSTPRMSPQLSGIASNTPEPRVDMTVTFVVADDSTPVALDLLDVASVDIDGGTARKEFTILNGFDSFALEGTPTSEVSPAADGAGTRFDAPTVDYPGSDPANTTVAVVASYSGVSSLQIRIGQMGTATTAGNRVSALLFMPDIVPYADPDTTVQPDGQIGVALQAGTPTDNGDDTYNIPVVVTLEAYGTAALHDIVANANLSWLGTYTNATVKEGEYSVDNPVVASTTGGAVVASGSANAAFDGTNDLQVVKLFAGNTMPGGSSATITFNITWYPPVGVDSGSIFGNGRADYSENGISAGETTDQSHNGTDPDPESDGAGDNYDTTLIAGGALPVELASFEALANGDAVSLRWTTASEENVAGFDVEQRVANSDAAFSAIAYLTATGNSFASTDYAYSVANLSAGTYEFRLRMIDIDGSVAYGPSVLATVNLSQAFTLGEAYPNPASSSAAIPFAVRQPGHVELAVFDIAGREVASLRDGAVESGAHTATLSTNRLPAGVYFYRLRTGEGSIAKRLMIVK